MHSRGAACDARGTAMHPFVTASKCVWCRYHRVGRTFRSSEHDEHSGGTAMHCSGIAIDPRVNAGHLPGTRVELRATRSSSSGMRFYCSGTALSPSDGPYTLDVTAVSSSATPTHWAGTALGSSCHRVSGSGTRVNWSCTAVNFFAIAVSSFGAGENCFRTNENSLGTTRHLRGQALSYGGGPSQCARNVSNWPDASACARGLRTVREGPLRDPQDGLTSTGAPPWIASLLNESESPGRRLGGRLRTVGFSTFYLC
jgi:hypothetical protein